MARIYSFIAIVFLCSVALRANSFCTTGQIKIKVVLLTDNYPSETSWTIRDINNTILLQNVSGMTSATTYMDSVCVAAGSCYTFTIHDNAGDGICCGYGHGNFKVYVNDTLKKSDSSFGSQSTYSFGCPVGQSCTTSTFVGQGTFVAPAPNTWYQFTPTTTGIYTVTNCGLGNTCNTKLYIYDYCNNLIFDTTNLATIYYADNNCGTYNETVNAFMVANHAYYIRIGTSGGSCTGAINWSINQATQISGCLDTVACNFNPFATISNPSSCLYYPSPLCPTGPDLKVDSTTLSNSITASTTTSSDVCTIREGCLNGYNARQLINFSTKISNIGATDFYAGTPPASQSAYSPIYEFDACHGHWHFKDYAEYLLVDAQNHFIPIGYKNGFCVLDLTCSTGTPKFGCNNMGITAGCADIYSSGLPCQWVDVTGIPDGNYKLVVRVNWTPRPDFYGRYETSYFNNWARACITLGTGLGGNRTVTVTPNCAPYVDCMGVENGLSVPDCTGTCNGTHLTGDLNSDSARNFLDVAGYMDAAIYHNLNPTKCNDLNDDGKLDVVDAALLFDCAQHGANGIPLGHSHRPCKFPDKIKNPNQHALFSIENLNYVTKTFDVYITNTDAKILGYQFKIKGAHLAGTFNSVTTYNCFTKYRPDGNVITVTSDETVIPKNVTKKMLMVIRFDSISAHTICIDSPVAVNEAYEEVVSDVTDSICLNSIPTAIGTLSNAPSRHYLYPNPMSHSAVLELYNSAHEAYNVTITSVLGQTVRTYESRKENILNIQKGDLSPGIYYLNVRSAQWGFTEKLLIE